MLLENECIVDAKDNVRSVHGEEIEN